MSRITSTSIANTLRDEQWEDVLHQGKSPVSAAMGTWTEDGQTFRCYVTHERKAGYLVVIDQYPSKPGVPSIFSKKGEPGDPDLTTILREGESALYAWIDGKKAPRKAAKKTPATKRITYVKKDTSKDYATTRADVLLDGKKIGEVVSYTTTIQHGPATSPVASYNTEATRWAFEAPGYRNTVEEKSRVDAVMSYLMYGKPGMDYRTASQAAGKKGHLA